MRYIFLVIISIISILILRINFKLYSENYSYSKKKEDIIHQLNFLESELKRKNLAERMQQVFPEGYVFINALYGLSWCELALSDPQNIDIKEKAIKESLYTYNEINSYKAKGTFDSNMKPVNGIYYFGWKNYLLSKILSVDTTFNDSESYVNDFEVQCTNLTNILKESGNPYLQSYSGNSWPADMFVAMASLNNYDKIFKPRYESEINNWIKIVKSRLDPVTHMIPHKVDSKTGISIQGARGCSMSLILRMLAEINPDFAFEQFRLFNTNFVSTTFGLPSVREYPKGQNGFGDVDSGPVIFGVGFTGTILMIGTFSMFKCENLAEKQYKTINAFGFGNTSGEQKKYLFGRLPMADAFIAWGRATELNNSDVLDANEDGWRTKFQFYSLLIIIVLWLIYFQKDIIRKMKAMAKFHKVH